MVRTGEGVGVGDGLCSAVGSAVTVTKGDGDGVTVRDGRTVGEGVNVLTGVAVGEAVGVDVTVADGCDVGSTGR
jgi:hypothetical protein